jgi:hypothetical protein
VGVGVTAPTEDMINNMAKLTHFLHVLLFTRLLSCAIAFTITESLSDSASAGSVLHYTLGSSNAVVVVLVSDVGDVDLYASPTHINSKPTSDDHEISSTSCGLDVLPLIMNEDVRKYTLGVHGHVRYDESRFSLYVIEPSEEDIRYYQVQYIVEVTSFRS